MAVLVSACLAVAAPVLAFAAVLVDSCAIACFSFFDFFAFACFLLLVTFFCASAAFMSAVGCAACVVCWTVSCFIWLDGAGVCAPAATANVPTTSARSSLFIWMSSGDEWCVDDGAARRPVLNAGRHGDIARLPGGPEKPFDSNLIQTRVQNPDTGGATGRRLHCGLAAGCAAPPEGAVGEPACTAALAAFSSWCFARFSARSFSRLARFSCRALLASACFLAAAALSADDLLASDVAAPVAALSTVVWVVLFFAPLAVAGAACVAPAFGVGCGAGACASATAAKDEAAMNVNQFFMRISLRTGSAPIRRGGASSTPRGVAGLTPRARRRRATTPAAASGALTPTHSREQERCAPSSRATAAR